MNIIAGNEPIFRVSMKVAGHALGTLGVYRKGPVLFECHLKLDERVRVIYDTLETGFFEWFSKEVVMVAFNLRTIRNVLVVILFLLLAALACVLPGRFDPDREREEDLRPRVTAGTYIGIITETEMADGGMFEWEQDGTVENNAVVIEINMFGKLSGSFVYMKVGNVLFADDSHVPPCISSYDQVFVGNPSGYLEEPTGVIVFDIQHTIIRTLTEGCSIGADVKTTEYSYKQHFQIEIKDGVLYGTSISSVEDGHPIKAKFVLDKQ